MNPFETETMADLHLRQGHHAEALAIYRRLRDRTDDEVARERLARRMAAIERGLPDPTAASETALLGDDPPLAAPGVRARRVGDQLTVEWRLPPETPGPALELLLITTDETGVATETRTLDVDANSGRAVLAVPGLHSARVAAGRRDGRRFVPLARG